MTPNPPPIAPPTENRHHYAWIVLGATSLILLGASGVRSSFGVFIKPLEAEFGSGRTTLSAIAALSLLLYGAVGPIVGRIADRVGPRGVLIGASVLLGLGTLASAVVRQIWQLYVTAGIIIALGAGGAAMSVAASLAARWFETRRGLALGVAGGGMAAGQLLIVPLLMTLTLAWGWRMSYVLLGVGFVLIVLPVALLFVRNNPQDMGLSPYGATAASAASAPAIGIAHRTGVLAAARTWPFWLLAGSFWVCGYTTTGLVLTHLIPHATEHGFHATEAAEALGLMGALNVVGTVASGWLCDRWGAKIPLAGYYLLRGLSLFSLPFVGTVPGLMAFAAIFGLNYISTVPATTSLTAAAYGRYAVGELSGWIFLSHQIGAAVGAVVGGLFYDRFGNYTLAFYSAGALALLATAMVLAIRDEEQGRSEPRAGEAAPAMSAAGP